jgi:hypothetical protein
VKRAVKRVHAVWLAGAIAITATTCGMLGALTGRLREGDVSSLVSHAGGTVASGATPHEVPKETRPTSMRAGTRASGAGLPATEFRRLAAQLDDYRPLKEKAVVTELEQRALHALLADPARLEAAAAVLGGEAEEAHTPKTRLMRMDAVDFLAEAIAWRENPSRPLALAMARAAVLDENHHRVTSTWLKLDFVGDKLELIEVLRTEDPDSLQTIATQATAHGSKNKAVLAHAGIL